MTVSFLKKLVRTPPGVYPQRVWKQKPFFGTDFELQPNTSLQRNIISTIEKNLYRDSPTCAPKLVNFGLQTAENGWRVFAHSPKFLHWETLPALPHGRYITDSRETLARVA